MKAFNWNHSVAYNETAKASFHATARSRLRLLAEKLQLYRGGFDLRSNKAGIAVSGEITLHADSIYVQVQQSCMGIGMGILVRKCQGRRDYTGGRNHWFPLSLLNDVNELAYHVRTIMLAKE